MFEVYKTLLTRMLDAAALMKRRED